MGDAADDYYDSLERQAANWEPRDDEEPARCARFAPDPEFPHVCEHCGYDEDDDFAHPARQAIRTPETEREQD